MHVRKDLVPVRAPLVRDDLNQWEFKFAKLIAERPLNIEMLKLQNGMHCLNALKYK